MQYEDVAGAAIMIPFVADGRGAGGVLCKTASSTRDWLCIIFPSVHAMLSCTVRPTAGVSRM